MFNVIWLYASGGGRLLRHDVDARVVEGITRSYLPGPLIYLAATLLALVNPILSSASFALVQDFYVVESSFFGTGGRALNSYNLVRRRRRQVGETSCWPWCLGRLVS